MYIFNIHKWNFAWPAVLLAMLLVALGTAQAQDAGFSTSARLDNGVLTLDGSASSAADKSALERFARSSLPGGRIDSRLIAKDGAPEGWLRLMQTAVQSIARLGNGRSTLFNNYLVLLGETSDKQVAREITDKVNALARGELKALATISVNPSAPKPNAMTALPAAPAQPAAKIARAPTPAPSAPPPVAPANPAEDEIITYDKPIPFGVYPVQGKTIPELFDGTPLFPPIEGLDESLWKRPCLTCHKWTKDRLCGQGKQYLKAAKYAFRHQHPYGSGFKLALRKWAEAGCQ